MSKTVFFENWSGFSIAPGVQNQWAPAEGSSLSIEEWEKLRGGYVVLHRKPDRVFTKIFALDEQQNLWSVVVNNQHLTQLKDQLVGIGFIIAA